MTDIVERLLKTVSHSFPRKPDIDPLHKAAADTITTLRTEIATLNEGIAAYREEDKAWNEHVADLDKEIADLKAKWEGANDVIANFATLVEEGDAREQALRSENERLVHFGRASIGAGSDWMGRAQRAESALARLANPDEALVNVASDAAFETMRPVMTWNQAMLNALNEQTRAALAAATKALGGQT